MITDDQIRVKNGEHPAPWNYSNKGCAITDARNNTVEVKQYTHVDGDYHFVLQSAVEFFNSRALALGLYQESEAAKLHKKFKFPLRLAANGVMRDAEDTALYTGCSKKDVFNFMIDAANAEARRQGVKFED